MVDVVGEPDRDAAGGRVGERAVDDRVERRRQVEVVDRDLERPLGRGDEGRQRVGRVLGGLTAVDQGAELDQEEAAFAARSDALYARFSAW